MNAPFDEVQDAMESERAAWIERRLQWLCAAAVVLWLIPAARAGVWLVHEGLPTDLPSLLAGAGPFLAIFTCAGALLATRSISGRQSALLSLAFWLTVGMGCATLLISRFLFEASDELAAAHWTVTGAILILVIHLSACVAIPWTFREATLPALAMLTVHGAILTLDVVRGELPPRAFVSLGIAALCILPGAGVCWFRHGRFNTQFRLSFMSDLFRQLQREMSGARKIHESSLPQMVTTGPIRLAYAYEPMRHIGGDLLYVNPNSPRPDRIDAVLLDVTGHGVPAALTVNRIVGELERTWAEDPYASPAQIITALNRYAHLTLGRHSVFMSAICIRVDASLKRIEYANGGHPPAMLVRGNSRIELLQSTAPILGVLEPDAFQIYDAETHFDPGDVVIAYTDGACEATNRANEPFGIERLRKLLERWTHQAPESLPTGLVEQVRQFRQAAPADDTLVSAIFLPAEEGIVEQTKAA